MTLSEGPTKVCVTGQGAGYGSVRWHLSSPGGTPLRLRGSTRPPDVILWAGGRCYSVATKHVQTIMPEDVSSAQTGCMAPPGALVLPWTVPACSGSLLRRQRGHGRRAQGMSLGNTSRSCRLLETQLVRGRCAVRSRDELLGRVRVST